MIIGRQRISCQTLANAKIEAESYINAENGVESADDAIAGALDIIAEDISDCTEVRVQLGEFYNNNALIVSKAAKEECSSVVNILIISYSKHCFL